jgi:hypothetical protein
MVVKDAPAPAPQLEAGEIEASTGDGHSEDWLGVILVELGVVSTVTVPVSVSSPGEMEVKLMSGGDKRSLPVYDCLTVGGIVIVIGIDTNTGTSLVSLGTSVSGVSSTEMLRRDMESSLDSVFDETA